MKRVTLSEVAKLAGVTSTTVSRVINNRGSISEKTRNKVKSAMETLNYQPNQLARTLMGKKSNVIGLIFPNSKNPFYGDMIYYLENCLYNKGYHVFLCNSKNNSNKERNFVKMLLANQVDGLIVGSHNTDIEIYKQSNLPIVSIDRVLSEYIPVISSDNFEGGYLAAKYLYNKGATTLAHINSLQAYEAPYSYERRQGFLQFSNEKQLKHFTFEIEYNSPIEVKKHIVAGILDFHPDIDGIFVADDLTAILTKDICKRKKHNAKIIGYDGSEFVKNYVSDLPTIEQPIEEMANQAVDILIKQINGDFTEAGKHIYLPVKLLDREK